MISLRYNDSEKESRKWFSVEIYEESWLFGEMIIPVPGCRVFTDEQK